MKVLVEYEKFINRINKQMEKYGETMPLEESQIHLIKSTIDSFLLDNCTTEFERSYDESKATSGKSYYICPYNHFNPCLKKKCFFYKEITKECLRVLRELE